MARMYESRKPVLMAEADSCCINVAESCRWTLHTQWPHTPRHQAKRVRARRTPPTLLVLSTPPNPRFQPGTLASTPANLASIGYARGVVSRASLGLRRACYSRARARHLAHTSVPRDFLEHICAGTGLQIGQTRPLLGRPAQRMRHLFRGTPEGGPRGATMLRLEVLHVLASRSGEEARGQRRIAFLRGRVGWEGWAVVRGSRGFRPTPHTGSAAHSPAARMARWERQRQHHGRPLTPNASCSSTSTGVLFIVLAVGRARPVSCGVSRDFTWRGRPSAAQARGAIPPLVSDAHTTGKQSASTRRPTGLPHEPENARGSQAALVVDLLIYH